jgi:DNA-binding NarL/FixJ family response regulator
MAVAEALQLIHDLGCRQPPVAVVAFAVNEVTSDIIRCAEAGAAGYVTADASLDDLAAAIRGAVSGDLTCTPRVAGELFRRLGMARAVRPDLSYPFLTSREHQVLECIGRGLSNKEIGEKLCVAVSTVKNHVHHVLAKLGVRTRAEAAASAHSRRQLATQSARNIHPVG